MTERTCRTCAWWEDCGKVFEEGGVLVKRDSAGKTLRWCGNAKCMRDPATVQKYPDEWCRHHATTLGWGEDEKLERQFEQLFDRAKADADYENKQVIERLKARCREARKVIMKAKPMVSNISWRWHDKVEAWLEASDDA